MTIKYCMLVFLLDRLYAVENARLVAEQENEDLHTELDLVNTRVCTLRLHYINIWYYTLHINSDVIHYILFVVLQSGWKDIWVVNGEAGKE